MNLNLNSAAAASPRPAPRMRGSLCGDATDLHASYTPRYAMPHPRTRLNIILQSSPAQDG
ncbi:hypothetical protein E2C01_017360 [Portunus trituberculatus]|uniref:Uncharacterized protein n=1 Tax=Portunus trituberculatus TaxID=210409 RepID=A0A5B7DS93_PORTR|nr:hypothetical protein [Portunus trituberculatus]